ncbi:MAG: GntR family transcriptional regulator [Clostridia bacterium]|jgi:DNA-binding FadR family transcriptional regulator|nr:GntR family transcriptional regulator [Clostridia bacterium]MCI1959722.1 GntR family transcriptional regulator [Clostridia bacterium]MCI1999108.1 GntR family transcriptional regulator [Clostridia bacterium]MCI2013858.1 GntR family transcriptional regulator [Clostridia bacterium]
MSFSSIEGKQKGTAVEFVINAFKELLEKRELKPGDRIPNETELSQILSVSRGSVREALKILSAFGVVDIQRGNGSFISDGQSSNIEPVLFNFLLMNPSIKEVRDFRECIERNVLFLGIKYADDGDIAKVKENLKKFETLNPEDENIQKKKLDLDLEFHSLLGKATHNGFIEKIYSFAMNYFIPIMLKTYENQAIVPKDSAKAHEILFEPILKKDTSLIENAIEKSNDIWQYLSGN